MNLLLPDASFATISKRSALFVPEVLTPLSFTPLYAGLSEAQRLRYNQLHGLYFLEQTIFFEQIMGRPVLEWLGRKAPLALRHEAKAFMEEEDAHTSWFRSLLREIDPVHYARSDSHLLVTSTAARLMTRLMSGSVRLFPMVLWLQLIAEERALHFGRIFVEHEDGLDPRFLALQRRHLADEPGHIRRDVLFLKWLWPATPVWLRRFNARVLYWVLREFFLLPKRSGWGVVQAWLDEFPELRGRRREFHRAMTDLRDNEFFLRTLYPRAILPRTRALAGCWPEMALLERLFTD